MTHFCYFKAKRSACSCGVVLSILIYQSLYSIFDILKGCIAPQNFLFFGKSLNLTEVIKLNHFYSSTLFFCILLHICSKTWIPSQVFSTSCRKINDYGHIQITKLEKPHTPTLFLAPSDVFFII